MVESCVSGLYAWLDIALTDESVNRDFKRSERECAENPFTECAVVDSLEDILADGSLISEELAIGSLEEIEDVENQLVLISQAITNNETVGIAF